MDEKRVMLLIALLNQCYWVLGSGLGALLGELLPFDLTGIDFAMTALFTVILVDQLREAHNRLPALIGGGCSVLFLLLLGPDAFLLLSLVLAVTLLIAGRGPMEGRGARR